MEHSDRGGLALAREGRRHVGLGQEIAERAVDPAHAPLPALALLLLVLHRGVMVTLAVCAAAALGLRALGLAG